jgi:hypothetical protein
MITMLELEAIGLRLDFELFSSASRLMSGSTTPMQQGFSSE